MIKIKIENYQIYIERLDEMIQRKEDNLFSEDSLKCLQMHLKAQKM